VFFQYEFENFGPMQSKENALNLVRSTMKKMSARARDEVRGLELSPAAKELIEAAFRSESHVDY